MPSARTWSAAGEDGSVGKLYFVRGSLAVNEDHDPDVAGDQFGFGLIGCQDSSSVFG